tara:strand:+ start:163 stop:408 length:246 start_codon:yes stop_codon:yes gene_type:complete
MAIKPIILNQKSTVLSHHAWIGLYCELSTFILEQSYLPHAIWKENENGDEVMTDDKRYEFDAIVDIVEDIMRNNGLVKEDI